MIAHPFADRFPMLEQDELERLAADIAENGIQNPIILDTEGRILDGRNRWAACELAGVEPVTEVYGGDDPASFVLSANVSRRHMTTGQQAMSTALVLVDAGRRENGRWKRGSVEITESGNNSRWRNAMNQAGQILDYAQDLVDDVVNGDTPLDAAFHEVERRKYSELQALKHQERIEAEEAEALAHLEQVAPDYLDRFDNARTAFAAWETDNREAAAKARREKAEQEAREAKERKDLTHTYTRMAEHLQGIGSYGHAPINEYMDRFRPDLLHPVQLIRAFDVDNINAGIRFLQDLLKWKGTQ